MALRKPLVQNAGEIQQLQTGDTLDAPQSGGDIVVQTNNETSPIVICTPVYNDGSDTVKKASAAATGTSTVLGLVYTSPSITNGTSGSILIQGILSATTLQWDAVAGTSGGLTAGVRYYLSSSTGLISATAPSVNGQYIVEIGIAISTTEMKVNVSRRILL